MTEAQHNQSCDYTGELEIVLKPRPSSKTTTICPACLAEVTN